MEILEGFRRQSQQREACQEMGDVGGGVFDLFSRPKPTIYPTWHNIKSDPNFKTLHPRSALSLKEKWRSLTMSSSLASAQRKKVARSRRKKASYYLLY
eukprot:502566-Amorphochlora_amoeboformis.AAC.2